MVAFVTDIVDRPGLQNWLRQAFIDLSTLKGRKIVAGGGRNNTRCMPQTASKTTLPEALEPFDGAAHTANVEIGLIWWYSNSISKPAHDEAHAGRVTFVTPFPRTLTQP